MPILKEILYKSERNRESMLDDNKFFGYISVFIAYILSIILFYSIRDNLGIFALIGMVIFFGFPISLSVLFSEVYKELKEKKLKLKKWSSVILLIFTWIIFIYTLLLALSSLGGLVS